MQVLGDAADGRVADRVVAAEHDRERAAGVDVRDGLGDLVEGLLDVAGIVKMSPRSAMVIDSRRSTPSSKLYGPYSAEILRMPCGPEAGARAVGGAAVERGAEHRDVVLAAAAHVLHVRRLEEGVDAGEVRQLAAGERRDALVDDGVGARQAELQAAGDLLLPLRGRQLGLRAHGESGFGAVVVVHLGKVAVGRAVGLAGVVVKPRSSRRVPAGTAAPPAVSRAFVPPWDGYAQRKEHSRLRLSDQAPLGRGRNPRRASPFRESRTVKAARIAAARSACFRPVTAAGSRPRTCRLARAKVPTRGGSGARNLGAGPRLSWVGVCPACLLQGEPWPSSPVCSATSDPELGALAAASRDLRATGVPALAVEGPAALRPFLAAALADGGRTVLAVTATDREAEDLVAAAGATCSARRRRRAAQLGDAAARAALPAQGHRRPPACRSPPARRPGTPRRGWSSPPHAA